MMNREQTQLNYSFFQPPNALIFKVNVSHRIGNLQQPQKNIEIRVVIINKQSIIKTKKGDIGQFLVADETGCCYMNFFNDSWRSLQ